MTDQDIFFTHTVVGQAMSIELGRRISRKDLRRQGTLQALAANMETATFDLPQIWTDWCLIQGAYPYTGLPRRRPGVIGRWLARHALILAVVGLVMVLMSLSAAALMVWMPQSMQMLAAALSLSR